MRRSVLQFRLPEPIDEQRLLPPRAVSTTSLDPNEDPVSGIERVSSISNIRSRERRRQRQNSLRNEDDLRSGDFRRRVMSVGATDHVLSEKYESLDYEIGENELYRAEENDKEHQKKLFRMTVDRWIACFLIGVCTAMVAAAIDIMVYYSSRVKYHFMINRLVDMCEHQSIGNAGCMWIVLSAWATYNCVLVGIAASLVLFVSPVAAGSGIPQIKCFLNGVQIPGVVRLKTLLAKAFGVACSVGGGLAAGKEGPMIHSGGVVAAGISQGRCHSLPFDLHIFEYFRNDREKRDFVSAGAAAGVAAAFAAPIGGVLFSLEEGASFWNQSLTWRMVFTAMISTFTLNCFLSFFYGHAGNISWTGLANFGVFEDNSYNMWEIPFFLLIGVIGGLSGALFNWLNMRLSKFRKHYVKTTSQKLLEAILVAAASAFIGFITLLLVDDCQPIGVNPQLTDVTKLWCPRGKYSAVATLFFQNPEESVKSFFHSPFNSFKPMTLAVFAVEYYILTLWTYGLSVPSGIFIPSLLTGAAWGRLVGVSIERFFPNLTGIDPGKYALAGAAAQLGGIVRMTISLTAIMVEATKDINFGLPVMLVLMITKWVGDLFNEGLYDAHIDLQEVPILGCDPPKLSRNILAKAIMRKDVVALEPRESVRRLVQILMNTKHHAFPVVDRIVDANDERHYPDYGHLQGMILRTQIFTLLRKKHFMVDPLCTEAAPNHRPVALSDFRNDYPRYEVPISALALSVEDDKCWIDLRPFIHPSPHRVPLSASLGSIFRMFRGLGLRHIVVVNDGNRVRGIITRKDIARYKERRVKGRYLINEVYISHFD